MCLCSRRLWLIFCFKQSLTPRDTKWDQRYLANTFSSQWLWPGRKHSKRHAFKSFQCPSGSSALRSALVFEKQSAHCVTPWGHPILWHHLSVWGRPIPWHHLSLCSQSGKQVVFWFLTPKRLTYPFSELPKCAAVSWYLQMVAWHTRWPGKGTNVALALNCTKT